MKNDKVSVIIPVYNGEKYIEKCLKSVIEQSYRNLEIIIVNDGSKDNSSLILEKYKKVDNRIIVINKKNEGVSIARNMAIDTATSKWVMFVDADDQLEKDAVEKLIFNCEDDVDIVLSKIYLVNCKEKKEFKCMYKGTKEFAGQEKKELIEAIFYDNNKEKISFNSNIFAKLYKRELLNQNNIRFKKGLKYGEDVLFNLVSFEMAKKIILVDSYTYNYVLNPESVTQKFDSKLIEHYTNMILVIKDYLIKNKLFEQYKNEYQYFVIRQLNKFFKFYFFRKENLKSYSELKYEFLNLIKMEPYNSVLFKEKISFLSKKRKIVFILIKMKQFFLLKQLYLLNN